MAQTIRITITPELEKALQILRQSTLGALNSTELIKMAVGGFANIKQGELKSQAEEEVKELNKISARLVYEWAKEDGTLEVDNISKSAKLRPFVPEPYVSNS